MARRLAEPQSTSDGPGEDGAREFQVVAGPSSAPASESDERVLQHSLTINVWKTADGRPTVEVVSGDKMTLLQAKGILHDALYACVPGSHFG